MPQSRISGALATVTTLFFAWGLITSLVDPLVAAVKGIFQLTDVEAQLSASAFFIAYGVMSFPAAALAARLKTSAAILGALGLMLAGCVTMLAAANVAIYTLVLTGLFVLASGITLLQVAANPLAAELGRPEESHFRLTLCQSFNSMGTFIGPYLGATLFLKGVEVRDGTAISPQVRADALAGIDRAFVWVGALILLLIAFIWLSRGRFAAATGTSASASMEGDRSATVSEALSSRWAVLGACAIFLYVGAEVAIGTQMAFLLNSPQVLDVSLESAAKLVSLYWGGAMLGRFVGAALLTRIDAAKLLGTHASLACAMCIYVAIAKGPSGGYAALAIGLLNSIMFPLIFTLTLERSTASPHATSGLLCFAIIGGAAIPPLTGLVSQSSSYATSLVVPGLCYALLCVFAVAAGRTRTVSRASRLASKRH